MSSYFRLLLLLTDIDDCHNHTCQNGASCVDGVNDYSCACMAGFTGSRCETGGSSFSQISKYSITCLIQTQYSNKV